jgi:hypothetical protein
MLYVYINICRESIAINFELAVAEDLGANRRELESQGAIKRIGPLRP